MMGEKICLQVGYFWDAKGMCKAAENFFSPKTYNIPFIFVV
jgi:hypothetical protein